ncbi:EAL domain-containing protein [Methylibium sp.]|uniref:EAL domain-containing protein n=1 Tax=Methylibium sp. TaxID=2067992 RepID=UPI003D11FA70
MSTYAPLTWRTVHDLIEHRLLQAHFQPIADLRDGSVYAHEALIRGPAGSAYAMPDALFAAAHKENCGFELEVECVKRALAAWSMGERSGRLFLNFSASALVRTLNENSIEAVISASGSQGVAPSSVVIELTEHEHVRDPEDLLAACATLRRHGVGIALDDFGDGRSSLRLWSELKPDLVKIDKYFLKDLARHGDKLQTLRALLQIAENFGSRLVAEGLEGAEDLRLARDLGISYGQGWVLGRPAAQPVSALLPEAAAVLSSRDIAVFPELKRASNSGYTASRLLIAAPAVRPDTPHQAVYEMLRERDALHALAVVDNDRPVALINRSHFIASYARPYFKELYGNKPCTLFANLAPLTIELHTGIEELTSVLTSGDQRYLTEGFIVTEGGRYRGLGTGQQLVRAVTEARIEAARHANPLTFLPGNIPISDHIERLLASGRDFVAGYADLNHFKPYNDQYGYWRGDEMIRLVARVLVSQCDARRDFVGHVGGDDFVILFQSDDWLERCERIVATFNEKALELFDPEALVAGGIQAEDRHGDMRFHPCTTLCIGAVQVQPGRFGHAEDVASAAAAAKREAKHGNRGVVVLEAQPRNTGF